MGDRTFAKAGVAVTAVALMTAYLVARRRKKDDSVAGKSSSFPIEYNHPPLPTAFKVIARLPKFIRRALAAKGSKPTPPRDAIDVLGEGAAPDPYDIVELEPNKIWRVRYHFLTNFKQLDDALKMMFGKSFVDSEAILANVPPEMRDIVANDIELTKEKMELSEKQYIERGYLNHQDTLVARLNTTDNFSGKDPLLLYNPCRMHPRMVKWLDGIGTVAYIVSGSSSHTNQLKQAIEAFPTAKMVCAEVAQIKCTTVGMRPADYLYTKEEDLKALNAVLGKGGASLHYVAGDTFTHDALVLVHGHLFECDLVYGRYCGKRVIWTPEAKFKDKADCKAGLSRMFYYTFMAPGSSTNGCIADYRCMAMDPSSIFPKLLLDEPNADGSSCDKMAASLRQILALPFEFVDTVHSLHDKSISADEFRKTIDVSWNWLDGNNLI